MFDPEETPQPFDRLAHRMLEDYGTEIALPFLGLGPGEATVDAVDSKLTALHLRLADKLFLVRHRSGERTLLNVEFFVRPSDRSGAMMHVYAAMIGYLQTQPEYRGSFFDAVAVYLRPGPGRYAGESHQLRRVGERRTFHEFQVVRLWENRLDELLSRYPQPFAALGPFCTGPFQERVFNHMRC